MWPPKEDLLSYEEVKSTNAAGILDAMFVDGNYLIALLGTTEHPNIVSGPIDPLFLKMDKAGNIVEKKWLKQSNDINEWYISAYPLGDNYLLAFADIADWASIGSFEYCIINKNGDFIRNIEKINYPFSPQSKLIPLSNKKFFWFDKYTNDSKTIDLYTISIE